MSLQRRDVHRQAILRSFALVTNVDFQNHTLAQCKSRLAILGDAYNRFMETHLDVVEDVEPPHMREQDDYADTVQETYLNTVAIIEQRMEELREAELEAPDNRAVRLRAHTNHRDNQRRLIERAHELVQSAEFEGQQKEELIARRALLVTTFEDFQTSNRRMIDNGQADESIQQNMDYAQQAQEQYLYVIGRIDGKLNALEPNIRADPVVGAPQGRIGRNIRDLQLGTIKPAEFNGDYANWNTWRAVYDGLIHREERLSSTEKFHHLKKCLSGAAARVLQGWEVVGDNYEEAYRTLVEVYDNKYRIILAQLDALLKLPKLTLESHEGIRSMVDTTNSATRQLRVLGSPVEHWDHILVYLLLSRMPPRTLTQWNTANDLMEMPTLEEVLKFLNTRARGILNMATEQPKEQQSKDKPKEQSTGTKPKEWKKEQTSTSLKCFRCQGNHPIFRCTELIQKPVNERIRIIKGLKRCLNCFSASHEAGSSSCKAGTCRVCKKEYHNSILCPKAKATGTIATVASARADNEQDF